MVVRRAILSLVAFGAVRIWGYISNPQPYLWWHGLLDFGVVVVLSLSAWSREATGSNEYRKLWLSLRPPLVYGAWAAAEGWRMWTHKALDEDPTRWRRCHICGRREDFLFNFAKLVPLWDGERVVKECRWHGPKRLADCNTGEAIVVPDPPQWPRVQRFVEEFVLYSAIVIRFCWFFLVGLFWRLVMSNDVTFALAAWVGRRRESR